MNHKVVTANDVLAVGMSAQMSFKNMAIETPKLARQFMPRRNEINHQLGSHTYSVQDYKQLDFRQVTPTTIFEKWVAVEVSTFEDLPEGMKPLTLKGGDYLVIDYVGMVSDFPKLWEFILKEWLPTSDYDLDLRPHFEKLPTSYNPKNLINQEEVWIPLIFK